MKNIMTIALLATGAFLLFIKSDGLGGEGLFGEALPQIEALRPPVYHLPVGDARGQDAPAVKLVPLEMGEQPFLQYPQVVSSGESLYVLSCGGSTRGEFLWHDLTGKLKKSYNRIGHGPGELSEPYALNIIGDEIFISEARKQAIHVLDLRMAYREKLSVQGVGMPLFTYGNLLGIWGYRRYSTKSEAGHLLTLHDRKTGEPVQNLVATHKSLFSLSLVGSAVFHEDKIYAITANTGFIDIVDTKNFATTRIDPHDGIHIFPPQPWPKWSAKHPKGTRRQRVRAWQATFPIPVDIGVHGRRLVVLYARGERFFFNVHDLDGALISRNHDVPISHPRINGGRIEGIAVDENDHQYYAYMDLAVATI